VYFVKPLQFSSQQPTEKEHLSHTSCAHQFVPRSGTSRKTNSTKKSPEKTLRYTTRYVFVVVFVKCIFISFLRAFLATSFPGLNPRALVVIIIFTIVIIIERV